MQTTKDKQYKKISKIKEEKRKKHPPLSQQM